MEHSCVISRSPADNESAAVRVPRPPDTGACAGCEATPATKTIERSIARAVKNDRAMEACAGRRTIERGALR